MVSPSRYLSDDLPPRIHDLVLERVRLGARHILADLPDVNDSLVMEMFTDDMRRAVLDLRSYVYTERLPAQEVKTTQTIHISEWRDHSVTFLDGPWQRWKHRHASGPVYRWLLGWWLRAPRYSTIKNKVHLETSRDVTMAVQVDCRRVYPESSLGPPNPSQLNLGSRIIKWAEPGSPSIVYNRKAP